VLSTKFAVSHAFEKLGPAVTGVSTAVPRTSFASLVLRKDTVPVGETFPFPDTVAVRK